MKKISALIALSLILSCGCAQLKMVSATASDGATFQYCAELVEPVASTQASELFCATDSALVIEQAVIFQAANPAKTVKIVLKGVAQ